MAYSDKVIEHYNNPRNVGALPKDDENVGTGLVGAPECGDVMKLQIKVNAETEITYDRDSMAMNRVMSRVLCMPPGHTATCRSSPCA